MGRVLRSLSALLLVAATCPAAGSAQDRPREGARPPNIVLILADDLGYGDLSSYGQTAYQTPAIDQLAREGVRLTAFSVPTPYCAPTRATLLTGRYPFRHGMMNNPAPDVAPRGGGAGEDPDRIGLDLSEVTLAEALREAGYATGMLGKWHLGHQPHFYPRLQGFDQYFGVLYSHDMRPVRVMENETEVENPAIQATLTRRFTERALDFIDRNRDRPFFLYFAHGLPHKPLAVSEDFYTPETPDDLYADAMRELDWSVGALLQRIRALGLDDNTLVIFLSDNGASWGGSSGGLRGMKGDSWEGGTRVPFLARWPGRLPAGQTRDALTAAIDIFPTLLGLAGAAPPAGRVIDGRDIWPVLARGAASPHEAVFTMAGTRLSTIRTDRWKLLVRPSFRGRTPNPETYVDPRAPDGVTILAPYEQYRHSALPGIETGDPARPMMLIDLAADPAEQHDVSARHPDVVRQLRARFDAVDALVPASN